MIGFKALLIACAASLLATACAPDRTVRWDEACNHYRGSARDGFNPERDAVKD